ncbi:MAG TPA: DedA family protein/thiosulfate sulfurtransferase GlpE [Steroidobacteraceae bacterium]|nr:DedA family protein/thiosulfate sulfurtransferase GlpE [Steroidobacteraceae bacterium]
MDHPLPFGLTAVFVNVLLSQLGLPLPVIPTLILAGALANDGRLSGSALCMGAVAACFIGDTAWYLSGRLYGNRVMKLLCRISLTPDSCVSQTQTRFERWGGNALVVAKFVPGLSLIAPPLAGATRMGFAQFAALSLAGSVVWVGVFVAGGMFLGPQIERLLPHLRAVGGVALLVIGAFIVLYVAYKWWQRQRFFAFLRMARISVGELYRLLDSGAAPVIVDVRSQTARSLEPRRIPGALHVPVQDMEQHIKELPRDHEIVLYCTCPNEASAAKVAKMLMSYGFRRVRPLHGGLDAWIAAGYAVETYPDVQVIMKKPPQTTAQSLSGSHS